MVKIGFSWSEIDQTDFPGPLVPRIWVVEATCCLTQ